MGLFVAISGMVLVAAILFVLSSLRPPDEQVFEERDMSGEPGTLNDQYQEQLSSRKQQPLQPGFKPTLRSAPLERRALFRTVFVCILIIVWAVPFKSFIAKSPPAKAMRRAIFGLAEDQYREVCLGHLQPALMAEMFRQQQAELEGDIGDPLAFEESMYSVVNRAGFLSLKALVAACNEADKRYNK